MAKTPASVWRNPLHFIAFGFGSGAIPGAPGTYGTIVAIPLYLLMIQLPFWAYASICVVGFIFGVWIADLVVKATGIEDHSGIVWDEIVGYWCTMLFAPTTWIAIILGFFWFRLFDILKPWPIRSVERHYKGGFGVMIDDVLAAIPAGVCVYLTLLVLPGN